MRRAPALLLAAALCAAAAGCDGGAPRHARTRAAREAAPEPGTAAGPAEPATGLRVCKRVVDGDTIELEGGEKVRLLGVDTPETKHPRKPDEYFGEQASAFTESRLEGRAVRLEHDRRRTDKYGRTLAYVWLGDTLFNRELVALGYAAAYRDDRYGRRAEFLALERRARRERAGMWAHPESVGVAVAVAR